MSFVVAIEFLAVISAAIYGVLLASRVGMDITGVFAVAFAMSFGGGTLRDLFLDRHPLFWIANPHYVITVFVISMAAGLILRFIKRIKPLLLFPDALGMGLFTMSGTAMALNSGTNWFLAVILGTITGTFGGVIGEVICNEIPTLFRPGPLTATCAFTGAWAYPISLHFGLSVPVAMIIGTVIIVIFRLLAVKRDWQFPAVR
ncbi:MAG: trimeric intracellular cation channel family protein [Verrucomicrobiales bacterium]|nr:trimeric intracellular cation channel family protein [Verrucomicrobiales bacterium]